MVILFLSCGNMYSAGRETQGKKKSHASGLMTDGDWPQKKVGTLPVEMKHTDLI